MPAPKMRQITRRLHAEHHEMVLDSERIGFALAIPSGATPDFGTSGVKLQWTVRLSFLVIPPAPEGPAPAPTPRRGTPLGVPPSGNGENRTPSSNGSGGGGGNGGAASHGRSRSFAYGFEPAVPLTLPPPPAIAPSGATHLMPVAVTADEPSTYQQPPPPQHNLSYRAVPDLGYVPVLFSSTVPDGPPAPGPLQKAASGAHHRPTPSVSASARAQSPFGNGSAVLVPAKVETVECSIPIKVYPGCVASSWPRRRLSLSLPPSFPLMRLTLSLSLRGSQQHALPPDDLDLRGIVGRTERQFCIIDGNI